MRQTIISFSAGSKGFAIVEGGRRAASSRWPGKRQIDGAFAFARTDFLVEARWTAALQEAAALYGFDGKVRRKLDNTLGLFLAMNGYSRDALRAFATGERPRLILMDGADLAAFLDQNSAH
jgi:hypothetical protein